MVCKPGCTTVQVPVSRRSARQDEDLHAHRPQVVTASMFGKDRACATRCPKSGVQHVRTRLSNRAGTTHRPLRNAIPLLNGTVTTNVRYAPTDALCFADGAEMHTKGDAEEVATTVQE